MEPVSNITRSPSTMTLSEGCLMMSSKPGPVAPTRYGTSSAPRRSRSIRNAAKASRSVIPADRSVGMPSKPSETTEQMWATLATSRSDFTMRRLRTTWVASTNTFGRISSRRASRSARGILT